MKRARHKESNRFKFIRFSERISNVNIDVFHRVPHRFEEESAEKNTYFYLAVQKWSVLNLTEKWRNFRKELGGEYATLPQLLNNKEKIVQVFFDNMKLQNELSLEPVLDLIVALVKDLRHEFYPFYPEFLKQLIHLLKFKDPDVLEATFTCLAYIFKYLVRHLVKDLDKVLLDLAPLLNETNPDYVRDFAAQSFAFVARKVKDKNKFLSLVLFTMQSAPEVSIGCGQLVFEMLKGIKGQSHSCAEELLPVLFTSLGKTEELPQKMLFSLTSQVVESYGNNIKPQFSILFKVLINVLNKKLESEDQKGLKKLLKITRIGLNAKGGAHVTESNLPTLVNILVKLLSLNSTDVLKLAVGISSDMLQLNNLKLPQEFGSRLIVKIMQLQDMSILLQFVEDTSEFSGFEISILPKTLQNMAPLDSIDFLKVLTKIVVGKTKTSSQNLNAFDIYPITLTFNTQRLFEFVKETLTNFENVTTLVNALVLVRHLRGVDRNSLVTVLKQIVETFANRLKNNENRQTSLFVLSECFETIFCLKNEIPELEIFENKQSLCEVLLNSLQNDKSILALRSLDLFLWLAKDFVPSGALFTDLYATVQDWLFSGQTNARVLALHSLQRLEEMRVEKAFLEMENFLSYALKAELTPLTINDYREKIKHLEQLNFERLGALTDDQHKVLLKYLLGTLYCNFKLLWDPICQLIASYSFGMPINSFWEVFFSQLRNATANCKGMASSHDYTLPDFDENIINSVKFIKTEDKVNHYSYRNLLWDSMNLFSDLCEAKNRDVISVYLPFIEDDILKSSAEHSLTINIRQNDSSVEELDDTVQEESKVKTAFADIIKCALAQLKLLSKFKNPKQCYKEPEVRNSYLELLLYKDLEIQKMALECLLTYKFSFMMPYKENLRNLVDDGKFKNELVHFQIDTESGVVKEIHREELMPIVMRILYSKMLFRSSTPRGNKGSASLLRRSLVLRFLAGSSHSEMEVFLKMAFKFCNSYCQEDVFQFEKIIESVDLEKVPPLKRLQNMVNLADVVLKSFGGLMSYELQRYIYRVLLCVGSFTCGILSKREEVFVGYLPSLKNLRTTSLDTIIKYFERFPKFLWREDDINALFCIFIWPYLSKLPIEGIHSPSALLRLFSIWSKNPRYFPLLARYDPKNPNLTPLPFILELLLNEKSQQPVVTCISSILENLLTLQEEEPMEVDNEEPPPPLSLNFILPVDESAIEKLKIKEELNYGSKILFPHVGSVLTFLLRKLEENVARFGQSQVTVLSRITEMATSYEHGDTLIKLLIKLLSSSKQAEDDVLVNMVSTVENLTNIVDAPASYLRSMSVLFGTVEFIQARKILVNLVFKMSLKCPELKELGATVKALNAWDPRWVEQPNFDKRLDAFKSILAAMEDENFNVDLAFIVLHNCFFFIRCETDISLRDNASHCLKEICPKVANHLKNKISLKQQWIEAILNLTKRGIVSENENYQSAAISLLGVMARECGELHPVLNDLSVLANKQDPEVDFFENAQHLQLYRRLKALQKFSTIAKTLKKPPQTRTLVQFILPLASRYLCSSTYSGKNSLIDSAIEAVAVVCKFLPWQQYQTVLRFYLTKLKTKIEFQKQLTRTVIAILDSFHFDLSRSPVVEPERDVKKPENAVEVLDANEVEPSTENENETKEEPSEKETDEKTKEGDKVGNEEPEELAQILEGDVTAEEEEVEGEKAKDEEEFAINAVTVLNPEAALKVEKAIANSFLEQLYKIIGQKTQIEGTHKLNYKNLGPDKNDEDCLKVPMAVTVVKLLQKLPKRMLETQLPGIFLRLCTYLKSRAESLRRVTKETLQQIIVTLGTKYLRLLFKEMTAVLTKGFQVHVMVFTMHAIVQHVQDLLQPGDMDENLPILLAACKSDLFGALSEEKEVTQIQAKHKEAKATKSYHLIHVIAKYLTESRLTDLIVPVKEVLQVSYSHKNITKCREYLRQATLGLVANQFISSESLYVYVYGTTSESIPQLRPAPPEPPKKKNPKEKSDCFILPPEPKSRTGVSSNPVKKSSRSNAHIIIEFGLCLLHALLRKDKTKNAERDVRCYLDPIVPILVNAIESQHVKVSTLALKCLAKAIKYDLPSIKSEVKRITDSLFSILHKYAAAGLCKGDNFDLVMTAFKAISNLIRGTDYHGLTVDQLKILLLYTEQDIYDTSRQATAFILLKTILHKKLNSPELHNLMLKVAALSITSELPHIRFQARQNVFQYMMEYPLKKKLEDFIAFYVSQLKFELETGRQSALEMIQRLVSSFPMNVLEEQSGVFLTTLSAQLVNDESSNCKKLISGVLKLMLGRLEPSHRDKLFDVVMVWFKQNKIIHRRLAAQVAGIFVAVEKEKFDSRLQSLLPVIQKQFVGDSHPGQFVKLPKNDAEETQLKDHLFFQVLQLLLKICANVPDFLTADKYQENIYFFSEICQSLLCHSHEWVRLAAAQFLGYVFNACSPSDVAAVLQGQKVDSKLSFLEPLTIHRRIKSLILDHCAQFIPGIVIGQEFIDQATKNLVYFARVLKCIEIKEKTEEEKEEEEEDEEEKNEEKEEKKKPMLTLLWLTRRMRRIINMELRQCPTKNVLRTAVIKWIGAVAMCSSKAELTPALYHLMAPIIRERELFETEKKENPLRPLVMEICAALKKKLGVDAYSKEAIKIRERLMQKRVQRRAERAQEFITNPEMAVKKKIQRQISQKERRKRKLEELRGKKVNNFKRRRKS